MVHSSGCGATPYPPATPSREGRAVKFLCRHSNGHNGLLPRQGRRSVAGGKHRAAPGTKHLFSLLPPRQRRRNMPCSVHPRLLSSAVPTPDHCRFRRPCRGAEILSNRSRGIEPSVLNPWLHSSCIFDAEEMTTIFQTTIFQTTIFLHLRCRRNCS